MLKKSGGLEKLALRAFELGCSDARIIAGGEVVIEDRFTGMCASPRCPHYGLAPGCPPHVMKPAAFRELLTHYEHVLVFKIDVPTEILLSDARREIARLVHETASDIERSAREKGFSGAKGFAAGSCKGIFCNDRRECVVLTENGPCLFPDKARPSLSGLGVNFSELCKALGWQIEKITRDTKPDAIPVGMMAGMVLIG